MPQGGVYFEQGSGNLVAPSGTSVTFESGSTTAIAGTLTIGGTELSATATEINRVCDTSAKVVSAAAATLAVTEALHDGKLIVLNKANGQAITLPAASGSGASFEFVVGTAITSVGTTIKVASASAIMAGTCLQTADGGDTVGAYETASDTDTITLNGTTTGGKVGDSVVIRDIAANLWAVRVVCAATGSEATPFSATVS